MFCGALSVSRFPGCGLGPVSASSTICVAPIYLHGFLGPSWDILMTRGPSGATCHCCQPSSHVTRFPLHLISEAGGGHQLFLLCFPAERDMGQATLGEDRPLLSSLISQQGCWWHHGCLDQEWSRYPQPGDPRWLVGSYWGGLWVFESCSPFWPGSRI